MEIETKEFCHGSMAPKTGHLVLCSGGADSAVVLAQAALQVEADKKVGKKESKLYTFHCNYGQKTEAKELECFNHLSARYGVDLNRRYIVDISYLKNLGGSSLTDENVKVAEDGHALAHRYVPTSYVPFRNGNLISIAVSIACVNELSHIWLGVVEEDSSGYPDCRSEFIGNMNHAVNCGLPDGHDIMIEAPIIGLDKTRIIKYGLEIGVPFGLTWSCYQSSDKGCGTCDSCRLRLKSFWSNNIDDPIKYSINTEELKEKWNKGEFVS